MKNIIFALTLVTSTASASEVKIPNLYCFLFPQVEITYDGTIGHVKRGAPGGAPWVNEDLQVKDDGDIRTMTGKSVTISFSMIPTDTYEYNGKTGHSYWVSTTSTEEYNNAHPDSPIVAEQTCHDSKESDDDLWEEFTQ